jgi:hypothetical protein
VPSIRFVNRLLPAIAGAAVAGLLLAASAMASAPPIAVGVNIANAPGWLAPMQRYAGLAGRNPAIVMWYQQWSEPLTWSSQLPNTQAMGAIPLISWDPTLNGVGIPLNTIGSGKYDAYIRGSADAAKAWGLPIYIRFGHEMNLPDAPFGPGHVGDTATSFIGAWRHIVTIFRQERATNVEWVWSPNMDCGGRCPFTSFFPGQSYVDWLALDGYNYSLVNHAPWLTFSQIFSTSYAEVTKLTTKPVMIAETASAEPGGNKAQWITDAFQSLPASFPKVRALVWFDRVKETDWTVNSSPASLAAWRAVVASAQNQGTAATLLSVVPLSIDVTSRFTSRSTAAVAIGAAAHLLPRSRPT